jgi:hypothetical protein
MGEGVNDMTDTTASDQVREQDLSSAIEAVSERFLDSAIQIEEVHSLPIALVQYEGTVS